MLKFSDNLTKLAISRYTFKMFSLSFLQNGPKIQMTHFALYTNFYNKNDSAPLKMSVSCYIAI